MARRSTATPGASQRRVRRATPRPPARGREWESIDLLRGLLSSVAGSTTRLRPVLGIGDDAAVLAGAGGRSLVWTIDGSVEGVHFRRSWLSLGDIGWRATHAAVSDVAAMGARPVAALCHIVLPRDVTSADLERLGAGQARAARALACPVIGGNLSSGPRLELATTVLGEVPARRSALARDGARPGDEIWLVGSVGLAAAGQRALAGGVALQGLGPCVAAWRRPRALVEEGLELQGRATACIDVSDGLVGDASHLAQASEVALVIDSGALTPVLRRLAGPARRLGVAPLELALWGGEDYALLATGPKARRPRSARIIGRVEAGAGVWLDAPGRREPLEGGYEHLR